MLTIIGGTYREICVSPDWDQLFGSGLRAAAACSAMGQLGGEKVKLYTCAALTEEDEARSRAETYGIDIEILARKACVEFRYQHPAARPTVYAPQGHSIEAKRDCITGEHVLAFGMLEGEFPVNAGRLVYDPQAGRKAVPLGKREMRGQECCIVANLVEGRAMLSALGFGEAAISLVPSEVARQLREREGVAGVIIKNGVYGAWVASSKSLDPIPCYQTDRVFSIGSGDVFSGVFAFSWAVTGLPPSDAAEMASRATAYYCNSQSLPIPVDVAKATAGLVAVPHRAEADPKLVYLAGPLFNLQEVWFVEETKRSLESIGLRVFSPWHEVGYSDDPQKLASEDLEGLKRSDVVLALVDGLDAGTIFEAGYATARGIPVVAYGERVNDSDLTMLVGSGTRLFRDFTTALYHAAWTAAGT